MFGLRHGLAELGGVLEHADQDLQTVEIRVLRRDHLKNGLKKGKTEEQRNTQQRGRLTCAIISVYYSHLWLSAIKKNNTMHPSVSILILRDTNSGRCLLECLPFSSPVHCLSIKDITIHDACSQLYSFNGFFIGLDQQILPQCFVTLNIACM